MEGRWGGRVCSSLRVSRKVGFLFSLSVSAPSFLVSLRFLLQRLYNKVFTPLDSTDAEDVSQIFSTHFVSLSSLPNHLSNFPPFHPPPLPLSFIPSLPPSPPPTRPSNIPLLPLSSTQDNQLYLSTRRLQFITPDHLDIPNRPLNKVAFHLAAEGGLVWSVGTETHLYKHGCFVSVELAKLDSSKFSSPWEKLVCILNSISILSSILL